jgi:hypothetical protein
MPISPPPPPHIYTHMFVSRQILAELELLATKWSNSTTKLLWFGFIWLNIQSGLYVADFKFHYNRCRAPLSLKMF